MAQVKYSFPRQLTDIVGRFMWLKNDFQWAASIWLPGSEHKNSVIIGDQDVLYQLMAVMEGIEDQRLPQYVSFTSTDMAMGGLTS